MRAKKAVFWVNLAAVFSFSPLYFRAHIINIKHNVLHVLKLVIATDTLFYTTANFKLFHLLDFSIQLILVIINIKSKKCIAI